ncbi:MarR family transcriptional regulator [Streptomyces sp. WMMC500]|uniref:MarR family winged helix-turn-helix transcriptional regulator n=1 Tax=Streptomyces sp. WMMC500 TaxID=3015154 RepID=UPI00248BA57E|nr:MarR family transcriptional regulator [Streptomyces sp. WMMC500]WBB58748.1 MarR family transcriptional regulator [Streptomyces sp. WMMC500]
MASTADGTNGRRRRRPQNGSAPGATAPAEGGSGSEEPTGPVAETRWLNEEERAAWLANSAIMISLPAALDARMQREARLTFFEYMVLSVLSEQPARTLQMSALAARTAASLSRLSHVVGRLEKRGLLARARIPGSGRRTNATLTDAGYEVVVAAAPGHVAAVREYLIDELEPHELATLRRIGAAVDSAIKREQLGAGSAAPTPPETPTTRGGRRRTAD